MKKFYTLLLAALGLCTVATAQTTADIAGRYQMTCEAQINPALEGYEMANSYNVTITASETASDSVYMDGFLGTAVETTNFDAILVPGKYDATAKTITFTQPAGTYIINLTDETAYILSAPLVLNVGTDADGNIQLKPQDEAVYFIFGAQVGEDSTFTASGIMENLQLTKQKNYTISKEDLIGTYTLTYVPLDLETFEPVDAQTSKFAIGEEEDGSLYIVSLLGTSRHIALNYTETGFTIDPIMEETETSSFLLCSLSMGTVEVTYGEGGTLDFSAGFALQENENVTYVNSGIATKDEVNGINNATLIGGQETAAPTSAYTLDGRRVSTSDTTKLPAGLYVIGGKKVIVR